MLKAVITDMDGLLVDTETICFQVSSAMLEELTGKKVDGSGFVGRRSIDFFSETFNKLNIKLDVKQFIEKYRKRYEENLEKNLKELPGATYLIKTLRDKYTLALVTGSIRKQADFVIKKLKIENSFTLIVSSEDVTKGKPDPEPYLTTAKKLNLKPEECIVLEDSGAGIKSAKAAGMKCIGVKGLPSNKEDHSLADLKANTLEDINEAMLKSLF